MTSRSPARMPRRPSFSCGRRAVKRTLRARRVGRSATFRFALPLYPGAPAPSTTNRPDRIVKCASGHDSKPQAKSTRCSSAAAPERGAPRGAERSAERRDVRVALHRITIKQKIRRSACRPKGGAREGAGRPRGRRGKRTQQSVAKADALGATPLDVLLESMHAARAEGAPAEAVDCAKAAAPYVHPKLSALSPPAPQTEEVDFTVLSDAELDQFGALLAKMRNGRAGEPPAPAHGIIRGRYPRPV